MWILNLTVIETTPSYSLSVNRSVELPFLPWNGLILDFPEHEGSSATIANLRWDTEIAEFCSMAMEHEDDGFDDLENAKNWYVKSGWRITSAHPKGLTPAAEPQ